MLPHCISSLPLTFIVAMANSLWQWRWSRGGSLYLTPTCSVFDPSYGDGLWACHGCGPDLLAAHSSLTDQLRGQIFVFRCPFVVHCGDHHIFLVVPGQGVDCCVPTLLVTSPFQSPAVGHGRVPVDFSVSSKTPLSLSINSVVHQLFDSRSWLFAGPPSMSNSFPPLLRWRVILW